MKNMRLVAIISFVVLSYLTTKNIESEEIQSEYLTEAENMNIKVVGPEQPIVAPSNNEQAMQAYTMGSRLLKENNLDEAERYLKEAIGLDPLFVYAMDHLGMVYRRQNRLDEAEEMYLKSININDKNLVPYQNLAVVYRLKNRLNDAFEIYKKMVNIDGDNPEPYYGIGELFYMVGDYENSIAFFDKAIELYIAQESMVVYDAFYYKGMIYYKMENYYEALKYLEEVQKVNPNNRTLEEVIFFVLFFLLFDVLKKLFKRRIPGHAPFDILFNIFKRHTSIFKRHDNIKSPEIGIFKNSRPLCGTVNIGLVSPVNPRNDQLYFFRMNKIKQHNLTLGLFAYFLLLLQG